MAREGQYIILSIFILGFSHNKYLFKSTFCHFPIDRGTKSKPLDESCNHSMIWSLPNHSHFSPPSNELLFPQRTRISHTLECMEISLSTECPILLFFSWQNAFTLPHLLKPATGTNSLLCGRHTLEWWIPTTCHSWLALHPFLPSLPCEPDLLRLYQ